MILIVLGEVMKKMLIVEDDFLSQKILNRLFKENYSISFCSSVEEYYNNYFNKEYDIIIMDISLKSDKNGIDLIKEIKENKRMKKIPILCLTAHASHKDHRIAMESGADLFISKPVDNNKLIEAVNLLVS